MDIWNAVNFDWLFYLCSNKLVSQWQQMKKIFSVNKPENRAEAYRISRISQFVDFLMLIYACSVTPLIPFHTTYDFVFPFHCIPAQTFITIVENSCIPSYFYTKFSADVIISVRGSQAKYCSKKPLGDGRNPSAYRIKQCTFVQAIHVLESSQFKTLS